MYSKEHLKYIKKIKINNIFIHVFQLIIILFFLLFWQYLADKEIINTFVFSSPKNCLNTLINLYQKNNLFNHIYITFYETVLSFLVGTIIGILIASILWWNKTLAKILDPYLTILNSLPKVALGPIIIIWAGASMKSIIIMALLISVIITTMNVYEGFKNIDPIKIKLMNALNATKRQLYTKLILPGSFNTIISTLKINISMSLVGVIMGEFLVSKEGIGYLIMYGSQIFNLDLVITGIIVLCIFATIMYYLILTIENKLIKK